MKDSDIQLIASLVDGQLSPAEQEAALARMEADAELRTAYDEQLAVATALRGVSAASMSAVERTDLHSALRAELRLEEAGAATVAAAATKSGWSRWWAPLAGLATAAVVVLAFVVVPNLGEDDGFTEVGAALDTSPPSTLASEPVAGVVEESAEDSSSSGIDGETALVSTTAAAAFEKASPDALQFSLAEPPTAGLEVPVMEAPIDPAEVEALTRTATQKATIDYEAAAACFGSSGEELGEADIVGSVTQSGDEVVVVITDSATGEETVLTINLATCEVTSAG